ncbi:MAG: pitrilysin family protein [Myxococcota bacterium]
MIRSIALLCFAFVFACGGTRAPEGQVPPLEPALETPEQAPVVEAEPIPAPPSGPARDISFPRIERSTLSSGLEVNVVRSSALPTLHLRLVIRSGAEADPEGREGLSSLVAEMLREGTRRRTSAEIAERIEFLGADLGTGADEENLFLTFRCLSEHLEAALEILAELVTEPAFRDDELAKLKRRETDRLALVGQQPRWLARRELNRRLYGEDHPYGTVDTTVEALGRTTRNDLVRWHRTYVVPNNAFLVVVGDATAAQVQAAATSAFGRWRRRNVRIRALPDVPTRDAREVVVVDRPGSAQSTIFVANLAIARRDPAFIALDVANQVLGGSAASRLFMDLRERRSLTYGAYSDVGERVGVAPFVALASVRTAVTGQAMDGLMEHLNRIVAEAPSDEEVQNATTYLSDSFPLQIATPSRIAWMVANLRIFDLPDDYWDGYRTAIRNTTPANALAAAQAHIQPNEALVVVVGTAAEIAEDLRRFGPVLVVDMEGEEKQRLTAVSASE